MSVSLHTEQPTNPRNGKSGLMSCRTLLTLVLRLSFFCTASKSSRLIVDSLPDIITSETQIYDPAWNQSTINIKNCYLNKGDGTWVSDPQFSNSIPSYIVTRYQANPSADPLVSYYYKNIYLADLTGDGLADWYDDYNLYPNTGNGWSNVPQVMPVGSGYLNKNYRLEDVNGDQLLDYVHAESIIWDSQFTPAIPPVVQRQILSPNLSVSSTTTHQARW